MTLMAAGWALAGCDFVRVPGLNARMVFEAVPSYLKTAKDLLALMPDSWSHDRNRVRLVLPALRRLLLLCASNYAEEHRARKASVTSMREHTHDQLLRAAWTAAYWNQHEITGALDEFGFTACCLSSGVASSADAVPAASAGAFAASMRAEPQATLSAGADAEATIRSFAWHGRV